MKKIITIAVVAMVLLCTIMFIAGKAYDKHIKEMEVSTEEPFASVEELVVEKPYSAIAEELGFSESEEISEEPVILSKKEQNAITHYTYADASNSGYEHYCDEPEKPVDDIGFIFEPDYINGEINFYGFTYEDWDYLTQCISGEAQYCSWKWQLYVGSVVLNRCEHAAFKTWTIKDTCLAKGQYACFNQSTGRCSKTPTEKNKQAAYELLKNGSILPLNVVFQAEFKQGVGVYEHIGNTYFCYINW